LLKKLHGLLKYLTNISKYLINLKNLKSNWGQLLLLLIPIILTVPPLLKYISESTFRIFVVVILFIISWSHNINNLVNCEDIKNETEKLDRDVEYLTSTLESVPEKVVKTVFNYLGFSYNERITIYRFENDSFVPVGRYSVNNNIKKSGRSSYPNNEGFIGKTWDNGSVHIEGLPDPSKAKRGYLTQVTSECNIEQDTIENISMKSRSYYCRNLLENNDPIAVIVFESLSEKLPVLISDIDKLIEGPFGQLLVNVIKTNLPLARE
jgi:hypothetical protein